jgi:hypothetical protein
MIDPREEVERVRVWDLSLSREATLDKLERCTSMAPDKQAKPLGNSHSAWAPTAQTAGATPLYLLQVKTDEPGV